MSQDRIEWFVPSKLARSSRPGWWDGRPVSAVVPEWIGRVRQMGVRSIVCLLTQAELKKHYRREGVDLLQSYAEAGFVVAHVPVGDDKTPPMSPRDLQRLAKAAKDLPAPILVHCSAGVDRTGCAVDLLKTILLAANSLRVSRVGKLIHLAQDNPNGCFRLWG